MKLYEVNGTYGRSKNESTIYVAEMPNGSKWYAVDGSQNVNCTYEDIEDGCDVEELADVDCFTWPKRVNSLDELEAAVNA